MDSKRGIEITLSKQKYHNPEYDDDTIDSLMRYFECDTYEELISFLKKSHVPVYN